MCLQCIYSFFGFRQANYLIPRAISNVQGKAANRSFPLLATRKDPEQTSLRLAQSSLSAVFRHFAARNGVCSGTGHSARGAEASVLLQTTPRGAQRRLFWYRLLCARRGDVCTKENPPCRTDPSTRKPPRLLGGILIHLNFWLFGGFITETGVHERNERHEQGDNDTSDDNCEEHNHDWFQQRSHGCHSVIHFFIIVVSDLH